MWAQRKPFKCELEISSHDPTYAAGPLQRENSIQCRNPFVTATSNPFLKIDSFIGATQLIYCCPYLESRETDILVKRNVENVYALTRRNARNGIEELNPVTIKYGKKKKRCWGIDCWRNMFSEKNWRIAEGVRKMGGAT